MKDINARLQEVDKTASRVNTKGLTQRHIKDKMLKIQEKAVKTKDILYWEENQTKNNGWILNRNEKTKKW